MFARMYARMAEEFEAKGAAEHRDEALVGLAGRVVDVGAGTGANLASLVLCTVDDPAAALAELRRVIRPGGELRFFEHVRAHTSGFARFQRAVDVVWPRLGGGCHTSRDTLGAIAAAGFEVERVRRFSFRPSLVVAPVSPHVIGAARRP